MSNIAAVGQVGTTYAYRAVASPVAWAMGVAAVVLPAIILSNVGDVRAEVGPAVTTGAATYVSSILSALLAMHVREQFAAARARVVPGYRAAHLGVAGALAAVAVVGVPLGIAWVCGTQPVGTVAGATCAAGLVWWWMVTQSPWLQWPAMAVWFLPLSWRAREAIVWMTGGADPRVGWALAAVGVVAVGTALWRAATLHEGLAAYDRPVGRTALEQRECRGGWFWANTSSDRPIEQVERAPGWWGRVRRWGPAVAPAQGDWLMAAMGAGWLLLTAGLDSRHAAADTELVFFWSGMATAMSGIYPFRMRRHKPSWEMTLPVGRREFFLEAGAAVYLRMLRLWAMMVAAMWAAAMLADPTGAWSGAWAKAVLLSFATMPLMIGVIVYALRHSEGRRAVELLVAFVVVAGGGYRVAERADPVVASAIAAVMVMMGVAVAVAAYHRWLETDLT